MKNLKTKTTAIAAAFVAFASLTGTAAFAQQAPATSGIQSGTESGTGSGQRGPGMRGERPDFFGFQTADADNSGDITLEEFKLALTKRFAEADADGNGQVTVEELAASIERQRAQRMAGFAMARFDADKNGSLSADELQAAGERGFIRADRNDDGKVLVSELRPDRDGMRDKARKHRDGGRQGSDERGWRPWR